MKFFTILLFFSLFFFALQPAQALPTKGSEFLISAACPYATEAAENIVLDGGNAVDAALTALIVMSVTRPNFAAFGGGGFAIVKIKGKKHILDFRERAPEKTGPDFYLKRKKSASTVGGAAVGVPGVPAGIDSLHKKFGKAKWSKLFERAIDLAENGFQVSGDWVNDTDNSFSKLNTSAKKALTNNKTKQRLKPGNVVKQKELAVHLKEIQKNGIDDFYKGDAAKDIVDTVKKEGGVITMKDLADYKPVWRKPIIVKEHGYTFTLMPPPSSGGLVIASALKLMKYIPLQKQEALSTDEAHTMAELLKRAYKGRAELGDPDFHKNPIDKLLSKKYLKDLAKSFSQDKVMDTSPNRKTKDDSKQTSHLSVMMKNGDAVSMTFTLNSNYGSGVATNKYRIFLNNEMDDFTTRPNEPNQFGLIQGLGNKVEAGKRPLSSMSPTLVEKGSKTIMAIGAPGGPRIISSTFQAIYRKLFKDLDIDEAIQAPRVHHQYLPNKIYVDKNRWSPEVIQNLKDRGHEVETGWQGLVYGVAREGNILEAAYDSRGEGAVSGF